MEEPLLENDGRPATNNGDDTVGGPWWLTGDEPPSSVTARLNHWGGDDYDGSVPPSRAEAAASEAEEIPVRVLYGMRLMNMAVAVALMISMLYTPAFSISFIVLSSYLSIAGALICCIELDLSFLRPTLSLNFGFTHSPILRFFFYVLLALIPWGYHTLLGDIVSICTLVVGVANVYILCKYPGYRRERELIAKEEEERVEELIKREMRGRMVRKLAEDGGSFFGSVND